MKTIVHKKEVITGGTTHTLKIELPIREHSLYLGDDFIEVVIPEDVNDLTDIKDSEDLTVYLYEGYPQIPALFGIDVKDDDGVDKEYVLKVMTSKPGDDLYPVLEKVLMMCGGKGDNSNIFNGTDNYIPNGECSE